MPCSKWRSKGAVQVGRRLPLPLPSPVAQARRHCRARKTAELRSVALHALLTGLQENEPVKHWAANCGMPSGTTGMLQQLASCAICQGMQAVIVVMATGILK